jgi:diguanylate cyclase (GGDEF)-like protein/PAS domain S-box-containing protein
VGPARRRRRPEHGLRDARTLRAFVEKLREGIYVSAASGEILDANPALLEILGVNSLAALRGVGAADLFLRPEERAREIELLAREGAVRDFEIEIRRPDGEVRTVLDTCFRVEDPETGAALFHGILVDITARKNLERGLREIAGRDALTGCHNRHFLEELAPRLEARPEPWTAVVLDVDGFKEYNDRWGHAIGDAVLRWLARFLLQQVRVEDFVLRLGGDEFVVLLTGADPGSAQQLVERLERTAGGSGLPVAFSLGWAAREGDEALADTVRRADRRLLETRGRERGLELPHLDGGAVLERLLLGGPGS